VGTGRLDDGRARLRRVATEALGPAEIIALRDLLRAAWSDDAEGFTDQDWDHALGGAHFLIQEGPDIVAHASVVERELHTGGHRLRTGYVEAVATRPEHRGRGHASAVMGEVNGYVDRTFPLGALDTGLHAFYERLGWRTWRGPTFVRTASGLLRTPEDDGGVMVRLTPASPELDLSAPISCEWRAGDVW
jgi:aminoglycoside 2'-N-acetyltransferase I